MSEWPARARGREGRGALRFRKGRSAGCLRCLAAIGPKGDDFYIATRRTVFFVHRECPQTVSTYSDRPTRVIIRAEAACDKEVGCGDARNARWQRASSPPTPLSLVRVSTTCARRRQRRESANGEERRACIETAALPIPRTQRSQHSSRPSHYALPRNDSVVNYPLSALSLARERQQRGATHQHSQQRALEHRKFVGSDHCVVIRSVL